MCACVHVMLPRCLSTACLLTRAAADDFEVVTVNVALGTTADEKGALSNFPLSAITLEALKQKGIKALFPIQQFTFAHVMAGKDVIARARTGTGKTLAFALPIIEMVLKGKLSTGARGRVPLAIALVPTRELAIQVCTLALFGWEFTSNRCGSMWIL